MLGAETVCAMSPCRDFAADIRKKDHSQQGCAATRPAVLLSGDGMSCLEKVGRGSHPPRSTGQGQLSFLPHQAALHTTGWHCLANLRVIGGSVPQRACDKEHEKDLSTTLCGPSCGCEVPKLHPLRLWGIRGRECTQANMRMKQAAEAEGGRACSGAKTEWGAGQRLGCLLSRSWAPRAHRVSAGPGRLSARPPCHLAAPWCPRLPTASFSDKDTRHLGLRPTLPERILVRDKLADAANI